MSAFVAILTAFVSIMLPGFFLALALLKKTKLHMFEIAVYGFIFGLIFPPVLTWMESYFMNYIHFFSFSAGLYNVNVIILTLVGILLSIQQGALSLNFLSGFGGKVSGFKAKPEKETAYSSSQDYKVRISELRNTLARLHIDLVLTKKHESEEKELELRQSQEMALLHGIGPQEKEKIQEKHREEMRKLVEAHEAEEKLLLKNYGEEEKTQNAYEEKDGGKRKEPEKMQVVWGILLVFMLLAFLTRIANIGVAPTFFEFDPYFDMQSTEFILTHGYQWLNDTSAWPTAINGTSHRIQPIVPYLEAYWYQISNPPSNVISTNLLSTVSSFYPPITAALLVFVVFIFLYYEYGKFVGLIGAALAVAMPVLISTFIAGEQLLEPWGLFSLFLFFATYMLAIKEPDNPRYAILAGIAFASTFLGAHYYTVDAGIFAGYIFFQGALNIFTNKMDRSFYKMNIIVMIVIALFLIAYQPYSATIANGIPSIFGIPVTIAFAIGAILLIALFDYGPKLLAQRKIMFKTADVNSKLIFYYAIMIIIIIQVVPSFFGHSISPLGALFLKYLNVSTRFTTPSTPLFMTVQEFAPTGPLFDFGANGFGIIAASIVVPGTATSSGFALPIILWPVLIISLLLIMRKMGFNWISAIILEALFLALVIMLGLLATAFELLVMIIFIALLLPITIVWSKGNTLAGRTHTLYLLVILPLAAAAFSEVKYLPHFGIAYILAIGVVLGEALMILNKDKAPFSISQIKLDSRTFVYALAIFAVLLESVSIISVFSAYGQTCNSIISSGNSLGYELFCNQVPNYWLTALSWMRANVGPFAPRVLSWWDYGDWINWFGNSNAVIRGDNAVPSLDGRVASNYVLGAQDGYGPSTLANFSNSMQTKYVLFDNQITAKWQALDFLACVNVNQTSRAYAISAAQQSGSSAPYLLGTSPCEQTHDPAIILFPVNTTSSINNFCTFNSTVPMIRGYVVVGGALENQTYCLNENANTATIPLYYSNGTRSNALLVPNQQFYYGAQNLGGQLYLSFMLLYLPNAANGTITNAPSQFYDSNYYRGFYLGKLPGFTLTYPSNFTGINYVNSTNPIMIYTVNNYTGGTPYVAPKPSWVINNFTMPG